MVLRVSLLLRVHYLDALRAPFLCHPLHRGAAPTAGTGLWVLGAGDDIYVRRKVDLHSCPNSPAHM